MPKRERAKMSLPVVYLRCRWAHGLAFSCLRFQDFQFFHMKDQEGGKQEWSMCKALRHSCSEAQPGGERCGCSGKSQIQVDLRDTAFKIKGNQGKSCMKPQVHLLNTQVLWTWISSKNYFQVAAQLSEQGLSSSVPLTSLPLMPLASRIQCYISFPS